MGYVLAKPKTATIRARSTANLGFEAKLWLTADKLRNNMDAAEYKHVVLGLIFLKYISDAFEERHQKLLAEVGEGADPEDPDEYRAENVFWVPTEARWKALQDNAKQPTIGKLIDEAMVAVERDNPRFKGILPKDFGRPALDKHRLGELIDVIGTIGLGDAENSSKDILGRVYEYCLHAFRQCRGEERWAVLLAALRGPRAGRDARAVQGANLRSMLRLGQLRAGKRQHEQQSIGRRRGLPTFRLGEGTPYSRSWIGSRSATGNQPIPIP